MPKDRAFRRQSRREVKPPTENVQREEEGSGQRGQEGRGERGGEGRAEKP